MVVYAVYKGENIIAMGTRKELAELLKVKIRTINFWASPANYKRDKGKRKIAIKVDEE